MKYRGHLLTLICLITTLPLCAQETTGQTYSVNYKGESLERVLKDIIHVTGIDLIYDPNLDLSNPVYKKIEQKRAENILRTVLEDMDLSFVQLSTGTYMLVPDVRQDALYAQLSGKVVDAETGTALPNASISIVGKNAGTTTNENGRFLTAPLQSGEYIVSVSYLGYRPQTYRLEIEPDQQNRKTFYLKPTTLVGQPLVVSSNQPRHPMFGRTNESVGYNQLQSLNMRGAQNVMQSLELFSGVNNTPGRNGSDIFIQGGEAGDHQVRLDGVPVYNPMAAGFLFSAFSPHAIDNITLHKAGYDASVGSNLSGVVDFSNRHAIDSTASLMVQGDQLSTNIRAGNVYNLFGGKKLSLMLTGRTNIWPIIKNDALDDTFNDWNRLDPLIQNFLLGDGQNIAHYRPSFRHSDIRIFDLHLSARLQDNSYSSTDFSLYFGGTTLENSLLSEKTTVTTSQPEFVFTKNRNKMRNVMAQANRNSNLGDRTEMESQIYFTASRTDNGSFMEGRNDAFLDDLIPLERFQTFDSEVGKDDIPDNENNLYEIGLNLDFITHLSGQWKLKYGFQPRYYDYRFQLDDMFFFPTLEDRSTIFLNSYVEQELLLSDGLTLDTGIRFTHTPEHNEIFFEPRTSLQIDMPDFPWGYSTLSISGGLYRQFTNRFDVANIGPNALMPYFNFWLPADFTTDIPKSWNVGVDWNLIPSESFNLHVEGFYKNQSTNLTLDYHQLIAIPATQDDQLTQQSDYLIEGDGFAYGFALSADKYFNQTETTVRLNYQFNRAERTIPNRFNGTSQAVPWNQSQNIDLYLSQKLFGNLNATTNVKWIPDRNWGLRQAYFDFFEAQGITEFGDFSLNNPEDSQLRYYLRVDMNLSYRWDINNLTLNAEIQFLNMLSRKNVVENRITPNNTSDGSTTFTQSARRLPGFSPILSLQLLF